MNIYFIIALICASIWVPLAINILIDKKLGVLRRLVCGILLTGVYFTSMFVGFSEFAFLWLFPIWGTIVYFGMGRQKYDILYVPIAYVMVSLCNYLFTWIVSTVGGIGYSEFVQEPHIQAMLSIAITFLIVVVSFGMKKLIAWGKAFLKTQGSFEMMGLLVWNVVLYTMVYLINGWATRNMNLPDEIANINLLIFLAYTCLAVGTLILAFRVIQTREQKRLKEEERKNLLEYTKQVESMYEDLRAFRHDYVNILATLSGYLEKNDIDGMKQYFIENILPTNEKINQGNYHLQKLSKIKEPAIKGLISSKLIYAYNQGIDVFIDIMDEIEEISMKTIDLIRILGIYLDNAIEATLLSERKEIKFNVIREANSVIIVLANTFEDQGMSFSEMEKHGISSKGEGRGIGLASVKEILKNYNNVCKQTEKKEGYFIQTLIIEKRR